MTPTTMTKDHMADIIATAAGCSKDKAHNAVDNLFNAIADRIALTGECRIPEIGTLRRIAVAAAAGRNPRTGETIAIPAHYTARFKPGKPLKDRLAALPQPLAAKAAAE